MTTPADCILTARTVYNDTDSDLYRFEDSELLVYVNEAIAEISALKPALFNTIGDMLCTPGEVEQSVAQLDAQLIIKPLCIHGGAALTPFDLATMDAFNPNWRNDTAGPAQQWSRLENDPLRFLIWPKAPAAAQTLDVQYVRNPLVLALTDPITEIPAGFIPAIASYVIWKAESTDDEHSVSGRAAAAYQHFLSVVNGGGA